MRAPGCDLAVMQRALICKCKLAKTHKRTSVVELVGGCTNECTASNNTLKCILCRFAGEGGEREEGTENLWSYWSGDRNQRRYTMLTHLSRFFISFYSEKKPNHLRNNSTICIILGCSRPHQQAAGICECTEQMWINPEAGLVSLPRSASS